MKIPLPVLELSENLRTQLMVFEIEKYIHQNKIKHSSIKEFIYDILRKIKSIIIIFYALMVFFEIPFHCYKSTTFYTNPNKKDNECNPELQFLFASDYFISNIYYRIIEIIILISFIIIQIILIQQKKTLDSFTADYQLLQLVIMILIGINLIDISCSLFYDYYPLINFFIRGILIILLVRNLRKLWNNILHLLYDTKIVLFLLFSIILCFAILGNFLYNEISPDFSSFWMSLYSLFVLLSTCNFPDVMLNTFSMDNKINVLFFIPYIVINYFIIFSLLKTLYYSKYFEQFKKNSKKIIKEIYYLYNKDKNKNRKEKEKMTKSFLNPNESKSFPILMNKIKNKFFITEEEYTNLCKLVNYKRKSNKKNELNEINKIKYSKFKKEFTKLISNHKFLVFLRKKKIEILTMFIEFSMISFFLIFKENNIIWDIIQLLWCSIFIIEFIIYIYYIGIEFMLTKENIRTLIGIINILTFIVLIFIIIFYFANLFPNVLKVLYLLIKILVILRCMRVILLMKNFSEFQAIFKTVHNMKTLFSELIMGLFSFFFLFCSLSMFLTGGKITKNAFENLEFPDLYVHINFNDFGSGFVACFCLTMINNINIIAKSLSYQCNELYRSYFAVFYFMSTLIILNICSTLLLEMYMTIKPKIKEEL